MKRFRFSILLVMLSGTSAALSEASRSDGATRFDSSAHPASVYCEFGGERFSGPTKSVALDEVLAMRKMLVSQRYFELGDTLHRLHLSAVKDPSEELVLSRAYRSVALGSAAYTPHFEAWVEASPNSYQSHLALGVHYNARAWQERGGGLYADTSGGQRVSFTALMSLAAESLEQALALMPESPVALSRLVNSMMVIGDDDRLRELKQTADSTMPDSYLVNRELASSMTRLWGGTAGELATFLESRLQRDSRPDIALSLRGLYWRDLAHRERRYDHKGGYFQRATYCGDSSFFWYEFGKHLTWTEWSDNAALYLGKAIENDPVSYDSHLAVARVMLGADRIADARRHYDIAEQIDPFQIASEPWDDFVVNSLIEAANVAFYLRAPARAFAPLERAVDVAPDRPEVLVALAKALFQTRQLNDARSILQRVLQAKPERFDAVSLSVDVLLSMNDVSEALALSESYLAFAPAHAGANYLRGWLAEVKEDDVRSAWGHYRVACEADEQQACERLMGLIRNILETPQPELYDLLGQPAMR